MDNQWTIIEYNLLYRHIELFVSILSICLPLIYLFILSLFNAADRTTNE